MMTMVAAAARLTHQENQNVPLGFPFEVGSERRSGKCVPLQAIVRFLPH
jgi:hypothetical protein